VLFQCVRCKLACAERYLFLSRVHPLQHRAQHFPLFLLLKINGISSTSSTPRYDRIKGPNDIALRIYRHDGASVIRKQTRGPHSAFPAISGICIYTAKGHNKTGENRNEDLLSSARLLGRMTAKGQTLRNMTARNEAAVHMSGSKGASPVGYIAVG
jgi:hypothetical protein